MENFLQTFHAQLKATNPALLQAHVNAEVSMLKAPWPRSQAEAAARWAEINSQQYVFDRRDKEVQALQRLTLGDLLQLYETKVMNSRGLHHRKFSVQLFGAGQQLPQAIAAPKTAGNAHANLAVTRNLHPSTPAPQT